MRLNSLAFVFVAGVSFASSASARVEAIFTNIASLANSDVPDLGVKFASMDRPTFSATGSHWIFLGRDATEEFYVAGTGSTADGIIRSGQTEVEPGRLATGFSDRVAGINDSGQYAIALALAGATTDNEVMLTGTLGGSFGVRYREGQAIPGIGGASYGSSFSEAQIDNAGRTAVRLASITGVTSTTDSGLLRGDGATVVSREGTTIPSNQLGGTSFTYNAFGFNSHRTSGDGTVTTTNVTLRSAPAASDEVFVANNVVLLQEGAPVAGIPGSVARDLYGTAIIGGDNSVFTHGDTSTGIDFVLRDGALLVRSGDAVIGGLPGETFDAASWNPSTSAGTFFAYTANSKGDYLIGGITNAAAGSKGVWQINGDTVVLREGDAVDLDGDGLFDDDAFIDINGLDNASLDNQVENAYFSDDGFLYLTADLRNAAGVDIGEGFFRVIVPEPGSLAVFASVTAMLLRRRRTAP